MGSRSQNIWYGTQAMTEHLDWHHTKGIFKAFGHTTSIHGVSHIFRKHLKPAGRFVYLILTLTSISICLYQCSNNVEDYLKMGVKTSVTYKKAEFIEFPSITFCSSHPYKRSQFGNVTETGFLLAFNLAKNNGELPQLIKMIDRSCKSEHVSTLAAIVAKYRYDYLLESTPKFFFDAFLSGVTNFQADVEKCWINGKEVECGKVLINRPSDDNMCFTYHMGEEMAKVLINATKANITSTLAKHFKGRINVTRKTKSLFNQHPKTVRFLLKSNQSDYCGTKYIKRGAGYFAMLTDRDATPIQMYNTPIYISPGYTINVMIKPIQYNRKTEHMGFCRSQSNVFLNPTTKKYMQSLCYYQCIMREILQTCQCYPANQMMLHELFLKNADNFNVPKQHIKICLYSALMCARNVQEAKFVDGSINQQCPECTPQCYENKYDYRLTRLEMSVNQLKKDVPVDVAEELDEEQLTKNYVDVSFSFDNSYIEVVEESQAVTAIDMFINLGNNLTLFLGMSFLNAFEILNEFILPLIIHYLKKLFVTEQQLFTKVCRKKHIKKVEVRSEGTNT